jgi:HNH endonuclease
VVELGLCECGCGQLAPTARRNWLERGWVKGHPVRFINGHARRRPPIERFAEKAQLADDLSPNGMAGCIIWTGATNSKGYGRFNHNGAVRGAHAIAWILAGLEIPKGQELDHLCRRPSCVNVEHLEPVTHAENTRRGANAKLNTEQVVEIRSLLAQGWGRKDIADAYGVHRATVSRVATGDRWSDD